MDFQRRDVKLIPLCHVATWISNAATSNCIFSATSRRGFQRRDVDFNEPLERRDVNSKRHDVVNPTLRHVATLSRTSRCRLVPLSVTLRRCPERRDVGFITLCNVVTLPRTSRRCPVLRPRTVHLALQLAHTYTPENLAILPTCPPQPCLSPLSHWSEAPTLFSDHHCAPTSHLLYMVPGHCGIPTTLCSVLAFGSSSRVLLCSRLV